MPQAPPARMFAIGGGILVVLTAIAAGFMLYGDVGGPIIAMTATMRRLAGGELQVEIPSEGRVDEVGAMADAVRVFRDNAAERQRSRRPRSPILTGKRTARPMCKR